MFTPLSEVRLLSVPLKLSNKEQILFNSRSEQYNYFSNHIYRNFTDFTYQRKDGIIRVPINAETLFNAHCNYVMYDNKNFSNKWIYAYITEIEYINSSVTHLHIKTDVLQTWLLDCQLHTSFIVRETVKNDELFKHTLNEGLPTGEHKTVKSSKIGGDLSSQNPDEFDKNYYCTVFSSEIIKQLDAPAKKDNFIGGVVNPCYIYATDLNDFYNLMDKINENGKVDAVVSCVAIPKFFVNFHSLGNSGGTGGGNVDPPPIGVTNNYLGSPYNASFTISQIYNPPDHNGIDMYGNVNTNIYTTCSGTVEYAAYHQGDTWESSYGNLVIIYNSSTKCHYLYGHLDSYCVAVGDSVTKGQLIGVQGNTGGSYGSHLHYQITADDSYWGKTNLKNPTDSMFNVQYQNAEGIY